MKFSLIIDVSLIVYLLVYVFVFSGRRNTRKAKVVSSSSKHLYVQVIDGTKKHALALFGLPFASIIEFFLLFPLLNSRSFSSQLLQKCFEICCYVSLRIWEKKHNAAGKSSSNSNTYKLEPQN